MQIFTIEKQRQHSVYYRVTLDSAGLPVIKEKFDCRVTKHTKDGFELVLVLDANGNIRPEPYKYLNETRRNTPYATRIQQGTALSLFHLFCDMAGLDPANLTSEDIHRFIEFLRGTSVQAEKGSRPLFRHPKTVNSYYGMVKMYLKTKNWSTGAINETVSVRRETPIGDTSFEIERQKDIHTLRIDQEERFHAPMHLNPKQLDTLANAILEKNDLRSYILMKLQSTYALRRGECLGITREDMKTEIVDGERRCTLILRNRVSDKPFQSCKRLYHPIKVEQYSSGTYKDMLAWTVDIDEDLYDCIEQYYKETRDPRTVPAKKLARIKENAKADNVEVNSFGISTEQNYYIFIGDNGRLLSGQTWNNHLKKYFKQIGIPVDSGSKKTNCSHRLRHTYAMYLTTYADKKATPEQVRIGMRHASISSGDAYYTPTEEEQLEIKREFRKQMFKDIPALSKYRPKPAGHDEKTESEL